MNISKVFAVNEIDAQQTIDRFVSENFSGELCNIFAVWES